MFRGPYILTPRPIERYPGPAQTWMELEPGPGQYPTYLKVFVGAEYDARRDELPIEGPSFTAKPPERPI